MENYNNLNLLRKIDRILNLNFSFDLINNQNNSKCVIIIFSILYFNKFNYY